MQQSLNLLRKQGYTVEITEKWNQFARIRQDMLGFIDLVAVSATDPITIAVQTTVMGSMTARLAKIRTLPKAATWVSSPYRKLYIHGWALRGARGKRKTWTCKEWELTADVVAGNAVKTERLLSC